MISENEGRRGAVKGKKTKNKQTRKNYPDSLQHRHKISLKVSDYSYHSADFYKLRHLLFAKSDAIKRHNLNSIQIIHFKGHRPAFISSESPPMWQKRQLIRIHLCIHRYIFPHNASLIFFFIYILVYFYIHFLQESISVVTM